MATPATPHGDDLAPRIAGAVFATGALLTVAVDVVLAGPATRADVGVAALTAAAGLAGVVAPWGRWPARAQLAVPALALAVVAYAGLDRSGASPYLAILPLPFVFVGFTQGPGLAAACAPAAAVALVVADRLRFDRSLVATLVFALPVSVLVGEAIAQAQQRRDRAERHVARLLHAVRVLARVNDERTGAELVASLSAELLDADAVAVLLADHPRARRYRNRASCGHPALADAAPLVVDARHDAGALVPGATRFYADASRTPLVHAAGATARVRSAALLALPGGGPHPIGVVVAMWGARRRGLPAAARHAGELLSQEAGRMFERLRSTARLAHDARTDPLTDLANRRTFARSLATLRPGDAVALVDLDHFKQVNDRHGHEAGDEALRALARCLQRVSRQVDCVARYGGEEFALVLPEARERGALRLLRRARRAWVDTEPPTTFSAGVAVCGPDEDATTTLRRADAALYRAKELGRNRDVVAASPSELVLP